MESGGKGAVEKKTDLFWDYWILVLAVQSDKTVPLGKEKHIKLGYRGFFQ